MTYFQKQSDLTNSIDNLPPAVKKAIGEVDVVIEISKIGDQFDLLIDEIGELYEETRKIIAGEARAENFVAAIKEKLDDEHKNIAADVASAINDRVLIPIRNAFMAATGGPSLTESVPQSSPAPRTPTPLELVPPPVDNYKGNANLEYGFDKPVAVVEENLSKEEILRGIEYPTPIRNMEHGTWNMEHKKEKEMTVPNNLPVDKEAENQEPRKQTANYNQTRPKEIPIVRTMQRDMAAQKSAGSNFSGIQNDQQFIGRGKFGHGIPPRVMNYESGIMNQELKGNGKEIPENQSKIPAPSVKIPTINKVENVIQDKLTKTVGVPKEEKRYTVDPYREPIE